MQWVKASERMPVEDDKTSIDTLGDVIRRFDINGEPGIGCCGWDRLQDSDEWLEGWNVDQGTIVFPANEKTVVLAMPTEAVHYTVSNFKIAQWWYVSVAGAAGAILGRLIGDAIGTVLVWWRW